jgi:hypothetical protein
MITIMHRRPASVRLWPPLPYTGAYRGKAACRFDAMLPLLGGRRITPGLVRSAASLSIRALPLLTRDIVGRPRGAEFASPLRAVRIAANACAAMLCTDRLRVSEI